jgi:hypothetical protein
VLIPRWTHLQGAGGRGTGCAAHGHAPGTRRAGVGGGVAVVASGVAQV